MAKYVCNKKKKKSGLRRILAIISARDEIFFYYVQHFAKCVRQYLLHIMLQ